MTHSSGLCLDINTCQISKECCIYDIFIHSSSWNQKIVFDFPPLILAVGRRSQLCYLVKLMSKFLCGSFWSSCHLKSLNLRSSCWTESFGHGFRARQVGMFSGCSIQSLWATPASVSVSDKLERAASSGAWKHKLTSTKQSHITVLKKEKEESTFLKFGTTNRGLGTVLTHWVVVHGICRSLSTIEVPDLFQLFCKDLLFLQMFMFLNSQWKQSRDTRPWRCAIISGTRQVSSSCF